VVCVVLRHRVPNNYAATATGAMSGID